MRLDGVALMGFGGLAMARLPGWDAQLGGQVLAGLGGITLNVLMAKLESWFEGLIDRQGNGHPREILASRRRHRTARALLTSRPLPGMKWCGHACEMMPEPTTYPGYRFPAEIISHAVSGLYHVFGLSLRTWGLILTKRGISVTHESVRQSCLKFGGDFARKLRRRWPRPGDTWHMDKVFLRINGELHYLWPAVDQHGVVLDILVHPRRNAAAAKLFFKRLPAGLEFKPQRVVTDGLRSYGVAQREILPEVRHRTGRYLNGAENSHIGHADGESARCSNSSHRTKRSVAHTVVLCQRGLPRRGGAAAFASPGKVR